MSQLKAMKWQHSAKTYLQQIAERIQESFWGSEINFPAHFTVKHPHLVLWLFLCSWTFKYIATSSLLRWISLLHSCFNDCLEIPTGDFLFQTKTFWIFSLRCCFYFLFRPQSDGIWLLQSETREGWGNVENYDWRKTAENIANPTGTGNCQKHSLKFCSNFCLWKGGCIAGVWLFSPRPQQRSHQL